MKVLSNGGRKPVSLSVHRNTKQRRREREVTRSLLNDAKVMSRHKDVAGYAIVTWDSETTADVAWHSTGSKVPTSVVPEFVKGAISRRLSVIDNQGE